MSTPPQSGPWDDPQRWSEPPAGGAPAGGAPTSYSSPAAPEPPSTIRFSAILMYVGAALAAVGILLMFTMTDEIREQVVEQQSDMQMTDSEIDGFVNMMLGVNVVTGLVGIGLWIWMAIANKRGLSWARIVATVLGGVNIFFTFLGIVAGSVTGQPTNALSISMNILILGLAIIILALLWQPQSTQYYEAVTRHRQQRMSPYGY